MIDIPNKMIEMNVFIANIFKENYVKLKIFIERD
jgi:hypothetical protein